MPVNQSVREDIEILKRYEVGKDIEDSDIQKLDELASIGLIRKGISIKRRRVTAKTTPLGLKLLK
jgi:hypothetical protein